MNRYLLFCSCMLLLTHTGTAEEYPVVAEVRRDPLGRYVTATYKKVDGKTRTRCALSCFEDGKCASVYFNRTEKSCGLSNLTIANADPKYISSEVNVEHFEFGHNKDVDCAYTWNSWGSCSKTCGNGTRSRTIAIISPTSGFGSSCPSSPEIKNCTTQECTRQCNFQLYSDPLAGVLMNALIYRDIVCTPDQSLPDRVACSLANPCTCVMQDGVTAIVVSTQCPPSPPPDGPQLMRFHAALIPTGSCFSAELPQSPQAGVLSCSMDVLSLMVPGVVNQFAPIDEVGCTTASCPAP